MGIRMKRNPKTGKMVPATVTQKRKKTSTTFPSKIQHVRESWYKEDFEAAKRRGKGIFTPAEQKKIKAWKAAEKVRARNRKVRSRKVKKASTRVVKKSKGYA